MSQSEVAAQDATLSEGSTEKLVAMVNDTAAKLNTIWDEVGFSAAERDVQITVLLQEVQRLFEEKVTDEVAVRDTFIQSIEENKAKATESAQRLQEAQPDLDRDEDGTEVASLALTEQLVHFENLTASLDSKIDTQTKKLDAVRETLSTLCGELEDDLEAEWVAAGGTSGGSTSNLSDGALARFGEAVAAKQAAKAVRTANVVELVGQCQELLQELAVEVSQGSFDQQVMGSLDAQGKLASVQITPSCVGIGASNLGNLQTRHAELCSLRDERSTYLMEMGEKVAKLWELLGIGEAEQAAFENSLTGGLSEATIQVGEKELARLEALKRTKIVELIAKKRAEVVRLWSETSATEQQRASFTAMAVTDESVFTDALLEAHDTEVIALEKRLESMQPLLKLVARYEEAVSARRELEELQKDKDRLKGRHASKQLKVEEGMGKLIKAIPKVIDALKKEVGAWQKAEGVSFCMIPPQPFGDVDEVSSVGKMGRPCLEVVEETEERWKSRKDEASAAKKAEKNKERDAAAGYHNASSKRPSISGDNGKGKRPSHPKVALSEVTESKRNCVGGAEA